VAGLEEELAQVRREYAAELVRRDEERQAALTGRDEEAARAADERVAEIEAEVAEARRALRTARAEAEGYRRELERERERVEAAEASVRRGRVTEIAGEPVEGAEEQLDEPATEVATTATLEPNDPIDPLDPTARVEATPGETVRVLGARRPRRTGEGPPADAAPGTAAIGARFIEPAQTTRRSAIATWLTRLLAVAALGVAIVAVLLVVKPF
jgi:hypothetical protein